MWLLKISFVEQISYLCLYLSIHVLFIFLVHNFYIICSFLSFTCSFFYYISLVIPSSSIFLVLKDKNLHIYKFNVLHFPITKISKRVMRFVFLSEINFFFCATFYHSPKNFRKCNNPELVYMKSFVL